MLRIIKKMFFNIFNDYTITSVSLVSFGKLNKERVKRSEKILCIIL